MHSFILKANFPSSLFRWGARSKVGVLLSKIELIWLEGRPYLSAMLLSCLPFACCLTLWAAVEAACWVVLLIAVPGGIQRQQLCVGVSLCVLELQVAYHECIEGWRRRVGLVWRTCVRSARYLWSWL